jgi:phage terminase small subunit
MGSYGAYTRKMENAVTIRRLSSEDFLGSEKMASLTDLQRRFVLAKLEDPSITNAAAALKAGAEAKTKGGLGSSAYNLAHNPDVMEALKEQAANMLHADALLGAAVMKEIALDRTHKDRMKAAQFLLSLAGLQVVAKSEVVHAYDGDSLDKIKEIVALSKKLGLDPKSFLGEDYTDAEFTPVEPAALPSPSPGSVYNEDEFTIQPGEF